MSFEHINIEYKNKHKEDKIQLKYLDKYKELFENIYQLYQINSKLVIAIDGYSSSGKSTLSEILSSFFGANLVHIDDFFMPKNVSVDKDGFGSNIDLKRLNREVISAIKVKSDIIYQPFDCKTQTYVNQITMKYKKMTIIEGAYAMHPDIDITYDIKVFLKISYFKQLRRINHRNGFKNLLTFILKWIPKEHAYFRHYHIANKADFIYHS